MGLCMHMRWSCNRYYLAGRMPHHRCVCVGTVLALQPAGAQHGGGVQTRWAGTRLGICLPSLLTLDGANPR